MDGIQGFIEFFIIMLAALVIFNTMSMSVLERTGQIGVMCAMGPDASENCCGEGFEDDQDHPR